MNINYENGKLVISVDASEIVNYVEGGSMDNRYGMEACITDKKTFIYNLARELNSEEEDGSNLVHLMIDKAIMEMLGNGDPGIDLRDGKS